MGEDATRLSRIRILERLERDGVSPRAPWTTLRARPFVQDRLKPKLEPYDDKGRSALLARAFSLRGGIAPFLLLWLGFVLAAPLAVWAAVELAAAGWSRAAFAFPVLLGLSPFVVETLALLRYPVGFYLAALLALVPFAVYAVAHPRPTVAGLFVRSAFAALVFALCVFCRSSAGLLFPGFVLAAAFGAWRVLPRGRAVAAAALAAAVFALPVMFVGEAQQNDVWQPVWEGLGDFDREKGYTWSDAAAREVAVRGGAPGLWTRESEAVFRDQILRDVRADPGWYGGILARRTLATVSLWKLWPWTPTHGLFIRRHTSANEGVIDKYWTYTTTVDHLGFGRARLELPIPLLAAPALVLVGAAFRSRWRARARRALRLVSIPLAAALVLPVIITTAGGQEAQAIGLVYLLAAALALDVFRRPADARLSPTATRFPIGAPDEPGGDN